MLERSQNTPIAFHKSSQDRTDIGLKRSPKLFPTNIRIVVSALWLSVKILFKTTLYEAPVKQKFNVWSLTRDLILGSIQHPIRLNKWLFSSGPQQSDRYGVPVPPTEDLTACAQTVQSTDIDIELRSNELFPQLENLKEMHATHKRISTQSVLFVILSFVVVLLTVKIICVAVHRLRLRRYKTAEEKSQAVQLQLINTNTLSTADSSQRVVIITSDL
ncbi:hypothetical protein EVAR_21300_1 [Eumeta japonica]|uniref:Uncharacterized protein n=1 Tax=Eumeta variegata TaxID=151549 RepID=A0A4C1WPB8_EUMVA|nr:hypothetical protein EVAR_21300_1 [Eumeta japonica]